MLKAAVLLHLGVFAAADCYLHNPRGGNNRLDDENRDRNNADRLFDSQNNNRGGSNVGQVYYYAGSTIPMQWSVQHSCGNPNNNCEMIIQVMCDPRLRDGTTTNTIPIRPNDCYNWDCDTDVRYGRHESYDYYMNCKYRSRNKGLFTSSQNLQGDSAIYTRQNPNGGRRGLECPEERDYYPYWGPTPWRDIAVLTNDCVRCDMYQAESQNVKSRFYCAVPRITSFMRWYEAGGRTLLPLNETECGLLSYHDDFLNQTMYGQWTEAPAWNIPAPECRCNPWARDNHHGNVINGEWAGLDWRVPSWITDLGQAAEQCVLRIRYNISTGDYPGFADNNTVTPGVDARSNKKSGGDETIAANLDIGSYYGLGPNNTRDYYLRNNPRPNAFGDDVPVPLQLAINTAQYGRTFQDRTHKFAVRQIPDATIRDDVTKAGGSVLTNVNVRGKRGNIVQTYPGTEYDFVPNTLYCKDGVDYVHFQWTGSNTNPDNNAGQGRQGSDRHNVVSLHAKNYDEPPVSADVTDTAFPGFPTYGHYGNSYPAHLDSDASKFLGFSRADMSKLAINSPQFGGELSELDDSGTYFDLGIRKCGNGNNKGRYHYLCTRNNNFSNRSQQAKVEISDAAVARVMLDNSRAAFTVGAATLSTSPAANAVTAQNMQVVSTPAQSSAAFSQADIKSASDITCISNFDSRGGLVINLKLKYETNAMRSFDFVRAPVAQGPYDTVDGATFADGFATASISQGGCYTVKSSPNGGVITGIVLAVLVCVGAIGGGVWYKFGRRSSKHI